MRYNSRSDVEALAALMGYTEKISNGAFSIWHLGIMGEKNRRVGNRVLKIYARETHVRYHNIDNWSRGGETIKVDPLFAGPHDKAIDFLREHINEAERQAG